MGSVVWGLWFEGSRRGKARGGEASRFRVWVTVDEERWIYSQATSLVRNPLSDAAEAIVDVMIEPAMRIRTEYGPHPKTISWQRLAGAKEASTSSLVFSA